MQAYKWDRTLNEFLFISHFDGLGFFFFFVCWFVTLVKDGILGVVLVLISARTIIQVAKKLPM